jgi:hypothetical protein
MPKKSSLNTDLEKQPKKTKKSDVIDKHIDEVEPDEADLVVAEGEMPEDDPTTYSMGTILSSDHDDDDGEYSVKQAPIADPVSEDEEGEWVDEEINLKDEDYYLDMEEKFDSDNPGEDDDNY